MESDASSSGGTAALVAEAQFGQLFRKLLKKEGIFNSLYRVQKLPDGTIALPILSQNFTAQHLQQLNESIPHGKACTLTWIHNPIPSKAVMVRSPVQKLHSELQHLMSIHGAAWSEELEKDLPRSWQRHGDLILLSEDCFSAKQWRELGQELWQVVAAVLGARRLAKRGRVQSDLFRSSAVTLLLGEDGWVEQMDNGIRYSFDVTQCMLSPGNITEKLRIASMLCAGEVVVDLYAGIGYFTLPYLIHAGAALVHACEWNPHAVEALRRNLHLNGVEDRCHIHQGDNRKVELQGVADRVNLGLIPTSEGGWPVACQVLRKDVGGVLHLHQNVETFPGKALELSQQPEQNQSPKQGPSQAVSRGQENQVALEDHDALPNVGQSSTTSAKQEWQRWAEVTATRIQALLQDLDKKRWKTQILHIEHVKSYAPHVDHLVLDLDCRPLE
ncbi:tRNA wybutosine-synthesizing protein 2 homolog [Crotalus tigris]|uniref:tRNA wybutosine-synthesizing protein 2 homolog n=1 Tax=Crotalus tigris TaxID=88082 RepID=UPI00192F20EF|nr:tRNA wybutosine-synthesizing protein 2 homolog [Crotalus tigris]